MTEADVKDNILHSLGTLTAVSLVFKARLLKMGDPSGQEVHDLILDVIAEFEVGFVLQITNKS